VVKWEGYQNLVFLLILGIFWGPKTTNFCVLHNELNEKLQWTYELKKNQNGRHDLPAAILDFEGHDVEIKNWDLFFLKEYSFTMHFHLKNQLVSE